MGSSIAVVDSEAEQQALAPRVLHGTWIGLHRDPMDKSKWLRVDGSRASYFNWNKDEPNNYNKNEGCVEMRPKWNDLSCDSKLHYVCKITGESNHIAV